ncbi:hypothetical protein OAT00_04720, partial [Pelagibacteraceae bacterium]|nr:hypothetical protein [Pelagibacteraceae bacterium]
MIVFFLIFFLINFGFYKFYKFYNYFNLYDQENKNVILLGGSFLYFNILFFFIIYFFISKNYISFEYIDNSYFYSKTNVLSFFLGCSFFFFIGLLDDKYNLSPLSRIIFFSIFFFFLILWDQSLRITYLNFIYLEKIYLRDASLFFTLLSCIFFINAFNFYDGINTQ